MTVEIEHSPQSRSMLRDYLATVSRQPFQWGKHDCCTVAAEWVLQVTGQHVLPGYRYKTLKGGLSLVRRRGFAGYVEVFAASLLDCPVLMLRPGDLAVMEGDSYPAMGIVMPGGERVWCFGPDGCGSVPLTEARRGFRVAACA